MFKHRQIILLFYKFQAFLEFSVQGKKFLLATRFKMLPDFCFMQQKAKKKFPLLLKDYLTLKMCVLSVAHYDVKYQMS